MAFTGQALSMVALVGNTLPMLAGGSATGLFDGPLSVTLWCVALLGLVGADRRLGGAATRGEGRRRR